MKKSHCGKRYAHRVDGVRFTIILTLGFGGVYLTYKASTYTNEVAGSGNKRLVSQQNKQIQLPTLARSQHTKWNSQMQFNLGLLNILVRNKSHSEDSYVSPLTRIYVW